MIIKNGIKKDSGEIVIISDSNSNNCEHVLQILSKAHTLAVKGERKVRVLIIGQVNQKWLDEIEKTGVDNIVYLYTDKALSVTDFAYIAYKYLKKYSIKLILFPATKYLKIVASILSAKIEAGLTADCIDIQIDSDNEFSFHRAAISGTVMAKIKCVNCDISMGTIKKDAFRKENMNYYNNAIIESYDIQKGIQRDNFYKILSTESMEYNKKSIDINQYRIVFGIGRGAGDSKNINKIKKIAEYFQGTIVGTRGVVEEQLVGKERQVGQSGKSISPRLYIALGISGASQHMVGVQNADIIIAVNNDENAPIFHYADYAVIEDITLIVDEMEKKLCKNKKTIGSEGVI